MKERISIRPVLFLFFLSFSFTSFSQRTYSTTVNFRKNKASLPRSEFEKLIPVTDTALVYSQFSIIIKGFADSDADSAYNYSLSVKRCETVRAFFVELYSIKPEFIQVFPMGEEISLEDNEIKKSRNRRVDVVIVYSNKPEIIEPERPKDKCSLDTLVQLGDGVIATFNLCEYLKKQDCIKIKSRMVIHTEVKINRFKMKLGFKNYRKVKRRYTTYEIDYTCKDTSCGKAKVSLLVPFFDVSTKEYKVQKYDTASKSYQTHKEAKIKSIKKKRYIYLPDVRCGRLGLGNGCGTYMIGCGGCINYCACFQSKIKFKQGLKIVTVNNIENIEENTIYTPSNNKRTLYFKPENYIYSLTLLSGNDTIKIKDIEITALRHGWLRSKSCSKKWFLFMQIRKRCETYRKYKFRRKDIELQQTKSWEKDPVK